MGKTKCSNDNCPLKYECYRFVSEPTEHQWYNQFEFKDGICDGFIETKKK
jgi:hypothetical protein